MLPKAAFFLCFVTLGFSTLAGWAGEGGIPFADAASPDGKVVFSAAGTTNGCEVTLREAASGAVLVTFPVDELFADQAGNEFRAVWKDDSTMVALNAQCGRSATTCYVVCLFEGGWKLVTFPREALEALAEKNTILADKAESYFDAREWMGNGRLKATYQGNTGAVNELEFCLVRGAKPQLELLKTTVISD